MGGRKKSGLIKLLITHRSPGNDENESVTKQQKHMTKNKLNRYNEMGVLYMTSLIE